MGKEMDNIVFQGYLSPNKNFLVFPTTSYDRTKGHKS